MCDRQHINEPDFQKHVNVVEPPQETQAFCEAFEEETENWRQLLRGLTPEDLASPRCQFGGADRPLNVRWFVGHMIQNAIYKHGQFAEVFYALGYDGTGPYAAPFPNEIYEEVRALKSESRPAAGDSD